MKLPNKRYKVIYADPPWEYKNKKTGGSLSSGSASKYSTMSVTELKSLPIQDICEKDCVIFMWSTVPLLPDALEILDSWEFKYKTMITWRKIMSLGMGYWFRGQTEHLLLGVKGKVKAFRCQQPNFIQSKVGKHSEKPQQFRDLIEKATNLNPKIELFARQRIPGWDAWGDEI